jgi:hypothetical protein
MLLELGNITFDWDFRMLLNRFYHECGIFGQTDTTNELRIYAGLG